MGGDNNHCSFVLLAEFHIYEGAQLKYQFPQPLGIDEGTLAMSMLPDGAETQSDDWTIFFLNQTPFNTISPVLALDTPEKRLSDLPGDDQGGGMKANKQDLLCVLNLVRTKKDKTLDRGAKVLALAICTRHPYIQIFKPFLLLALDDYFSDPSQDCLARLFDAVNSMDLSLAPRLTRYEKLVMRFSDRKDIFAEKFPLLMPRDTNAFNSMHPSVGSSHCPSNLGGPTPNVENGFLMRNKDKEEFQEPFRNKEPESRRIRDNESSGMMDQQCHHQQLSSDSSFSLGGSAVWVGNETDITARQMETEGTTVGLLIRNNTSTDLEHRRRSLDTSSLSSQAHPKVQSMNATYTTLDGQIRAAMNKDTHFFHTTVAYRDYQLPIKVPLSTFPEEVGDYSLITLIKVFSSHQLVSGPQHPHLHTNGPQTHPIIILFNALVTGKRIMFLGHKKPAGDVSSFVLAACALGSGCGAVLRGFIDRAFPYANLENREEWENVPAYIAGVTNPIFESSRTWDLLLDISSGAVTVSRDIHVRYPASNVGLTVSHTVRLSTLKTEAPVASEDEIGRSMKEPKIDSVGKIDYNADKNFIDDIRAAIDDHFGENLVRMRFTEYVMRFIRLASRYEEETTGITKIGYATSSFIEGSTDRSSQIGSGIVFNDESTCLRELNANAHRIQAWRSTNSYKYCVADFCRHQTASTIKGIDVLYQVLRLKNGKNIADAEVSTITRMLADNVRTYEQVVELLAYLVPYGGGLMHLGFCLFHQQKMVREATVDLFNHFRAYPVGVIFLQTLNHFQRYAFVRQAHTREQQSLSEQLLYDQRPQ
ncbi:hypothetical protein AX17_005727 [Amanita inopinata Kibby_2008]|nr:hypothetical protein AX17_005727 [Amanita inopinata Kibby_2008]